MWVVTGLASCTHFFLQEILMKREIKEKEKFLILDFGNAACEIFCRLIERMSRILLVTCIVRSKKTFFQMSDMRGKECQSVL